MRITRRHAAMIGGAAIAGALLAAIVLSHHWAAILVGATMGAGGVTLNLTVTQALRRSPMRAR